MLTSIIDKLLVSVIVLLLMTGCATSDPAKPEKSGKIVHVSIDDVEAWGALVENEERYDSLFDEPLFALLRELHEEYGAKFTLYTYPTLKEGRLKITSVPLKFRDEFRDCSSWLRIGYHWPAPQFSEDITVSEFKRGYDMVRNAIGDFADSTMLATALRVHYYYSPDSLLNQLDGVHTLLCADSDGRVSYDLDTDEAATVWTRGRLRKNDRLYLRTDLRTENRVDIRSALEKRCEADTLVLFTHHWVLGLTHAEGVVGMAKHIYHQFSKNNNLRNFKDAVAWLYENGYEFSFL